MSSPTVNALSRGPKYISDDEEDSRFDYLASPELVDILTRFMLGGRAPQQVEEGVTHPLDPNRDRTTYISEQPPPVDLLGSAMQRGDPLAWMEQVQEPEGAPEPSLVETLARKFPQLAEQVAIMGGAAKGVGGMRGQPRMAWEPQFGAEKMSPASGRKPARFQLPVEIDYKDGYPPQVDIVRGIDREDALARAKERWPSAEIREVSPQDKRVAERKELVRNTSREINAEKEQRQDFYGIEPAPAPKQIEPSQELIDALAEFKNMTPDQFEAAVKSVEVVEPSATNLPVNASAESGSGGSVEAGSRFKSMERRGIKYVIVDRAGNVRPSTEDTPRLSPNEAWGEMDAEGNFTPLEGNKMVKPKKVK